MTIRTIDNDIKLIPYYRNDEASFPWYQDPDVCKQVDNIDHVYDLDTLHRMYDYLSSHGDCYYIEYQGVLVGDVSLRNSKELAIVICKEYQNRHIGRKCITDMLSLARERAWTVSGPISIPSTNKAKRCSSPWALPGSARKNMN